MSVIIEVVQYIQDPIRQTARYKSPRSLAFHYRYFSFFVKSNVASTFLYLPRVDHGFRTSLNSKEYRYSDTDEQRPNKIRDPAHKAGFHGSRAKQGAVSSCAVRG